MREVLMLERRAFALTLGCLAFSACGGDGDGNGGGRDFQRAIEPQAQEHAESILLTLTNFPDGWRVEEPAKDDDAEKESDEAFAECIGADYSAFTMIGDAESDDFAMGETAVASSEAQVFESEQMAAAAVEEFAEGLESEVADTCMSEMLAEFEDESVEITAARGRRTQPHAPPGVDVANAWQVEVTVKGKAGSQAEGLSVTAYADLVQLRKGDQTAQVTTTDLQTPVDPELRDALVAAVAGRMAD
jgi:hypothetical protein